MHDLLSGINELERSTSWNEETAYAFIFQGISELLARDVQQLFRLLYRIDVREQLVKEVFAAADQPQDIASRLSILIIDRLKQKAEIRRRYSS